ncbi:MAG: hypothetical protein GX657_00665 [Chloroflexi bacterium]|nr:hypothetical protein [Chloroflexota bacterium]
MSALRDRPLAQLAAGLFLVGALAASIVLGLRLGRALGAERDLRARYQAAAAAAERPYAVQAREQLAAAQGEAASCAAGLALPTDVDAALADLRALALAEGLDLTVTPVGAGGSARATGPDGSAAPWEEQRYLLSARGGLEGLLALLAAAQEEGAAFRLEEVAIMAAEAAPAAEAAADTYSLRATLTVITSGWAADADRPQAAARPDRVAPAQSARQYRPPTGQE